VRPKDGKRKATDLSNLLELKELTRLKYVAEYREDVDDPYRRVRGSQERLQTIEEPLRRLSSERIKEIYDSGLGREIEGCDVRLYKIKRLTCRAGSGLNIAGNCLTRLLDRLGVTLDTHNTPIADLMRNYHNTPVPGPNVKKKG